MCTQSRAASMRWRNSVYRLAEARMNWVHRWGALRDRTSTAESDSRATLHVVTALNSKGAVNRVNADTSGSSSPGFAMNARETLEASPAISKFATQASRSPCRCTNRYFAAAPGLCNVSPACSTTTSTLLTTTSRIMSSSVPAVSTGGSAVQLRRFGGCAGRPRMLRKASAGEDKFTDSTACSGISCSSRSELSPKKVCRVPKATRWSRATSKDSMCKQTAGSSRCTF
mmetsp:Transcript_20862/g.46609  ORF Transcript_20862/g.46609 Transcript_20862/m.46609 type:complete len:228 (-) Transcript_20862:815-1498(-)